MTVENDNNSRSFPQNIRRLVYVAQNGLCADCGCELPSDFHVDHDIPYSIGGKTTLDNARGLCPSCNLKKGNNLSVTMPKNIKPRTWQKEAFIKFAQSVLAESYIKFLIQATPGGGKTVAACMKVAWLLEREFVERVVVISPSINLRMSWANEMAKFGIQIDPDCTSDVSENSDYIGKSITYASLAVSGAISKIGGAHCESIQQRKKNTVVVCDEIHHAGKSLSWGEGLSIACKHAKYIIMLSGTPFRNDGNRIPFVSYDKSGIVIADHVYGYKEALDDFVCRPVYFPSFEGNVSWIENEEIYKASFKDELNDEDQSKLLHNWSRSEGSVDKILQEARYTLEEKRGKHPQAGGLVIAMDKQHAEWLASRMKRLGFSDPIVITSDDKDAQDKINKFRKSVDPWMIAIKMVSEGVDIPRLRVCVYLSNIVSELFFRQVVGRIIRYSDGIPDQEAFFYMAADRRLIEMAQRIQEERISAIIDESEEIIDNDLYDERIVDDREWRITQLLDSDAWHDTTITFQGEIYTRAELDYAREFAISRNYSVSVEVMAKMLRDGAFPTVTQPANNQTYDEKPIYEKRRDMKKKLNNQERRLLSELRNRYYNGVPESEGFAKINSALNRHVGIKSKSDATVEQLKERHDVLISAVKLPRGEKPTWLM